MGSIFLLLSIAASSFIVLYFKYIERFGLHLLPIIAVNYWVCVICGAIYSPHFFTNVIHCEKNIVPLAMGLGALFISVFFLMGKLTQDIGAGFVAIVTKMSVMIPILFSLYFLNETLTTTKGIGIGIALLALILIQYPKESSENQAKVSFTFKQILPMLAIFFGSGAIDCLMNVYNVKFSDALSNSSDFTVFLFGTAAIVGTIVLTILLVRGKVSLTYKEILAGICLGIPNYFSINFLLKALSYMEGSIFFPLNNVGIVMMVCLMGIIFFKESYSRINYSGVALALLAIFLMAGGGTGFSPF